MLKYFSQIFFDHQKEKILFKFSQIGNQFVIFQKACIKHDTIYKLFGNSPLKAVDYQVLVFITVHKKSSTNFAKHEKIICTYI